MQCSYTPSECHRISATGTLTHRHCISCYMQEEIKIVTASNGEITRVMLRFQPLLSKNVDLDRSVCDCLWGDLPQSPAINLFVPRRAVAHSRPRVKSGVAVKSTLANDHSMTTPNIDLSKKNFFLI